MRYKNLTKLLFFSLKKIPSIKSELTLSFFNTFEFFDFFISLDTFKPIINSKKNFYDEKINMNSVLYF